MDSAVEELRANLDEALSANRRANALIGAQAEESDEIIASLKLGNLLLEKVIATQNQKDNPLHKRIAELAHGLRHCTCECSDNHGLILFQSETGKTPICPVCAEIFKFKQFKDRTKFLLEFVFDELLRFSPSGDYDNRLKAQKEFLNKLDLL